MAKLLTGLDDSARTIVYAAIVAALKADATLTATIPAAQWTTYLDDSAGLRRNVPQDNNGLPAIRLMPFGTPAGSETQTRQNSPMGIQVKVTTAGHDVRDLMNLWAAFESALFTGDGSRVLNNAIRAALKSASEARGRSLGSLETINLVAPALGASTDSGGNEFMTADGAIVAMMTVPK
jgi:hypothetical protein